MASRRPSVPKAQFTTGIGSDPDKAGKKAALPSTTADPTPADSPTPSGGKSSKLGKSGPAGNGSKGAKRGRQRATGPNTRSSQEGISQTGGDSPVPARSFSGRLLVLGLTMAVVTLLLAPNVHTFLEQRAEIASLHEDIAAKESQQSAYKSELARWDDPAFIKQQARDRVSMLMPGETGYWVYGANGVEALDDSVDAAKAAAAQATTAKNATAIEVDPWVDSLWEAVQKSAVVEVPAAVPEPAPVP